MIDPLPVWCAWCREELTAEERTGAESTNARSAASPGCSSK